MKVKYFALFRQKLNLAEEDIHLPEHICTGYEVLNWLCQKDELYKKTFWPIESVCMAVDHELLPLETSIKNAQEIAFFPPITGG